MSKKRYSLSLIAILIIFAVGLCGGFAIQEYRYTGRLFSDAGLTSEQIRALNEALYIVDHYAIEEHDENFSVDYALKGIAASLGDDYAYYFTPEELAAYLDSSSGTVEGSIGANVYKDGEDIIVTSVFKGLPADTAGIKKCDKIIAVDGTDVRGKTLEEVVALVKGETGTEVTVTVEREGRELAFCLARADGQRQMTEYSFIGDTKILYIAIFSFHGNAVEYFEEAIEYGKAGGYEGIIIDLRENSGGELSIFEQIADIMLPEGETFYALRRDGQKIQSCTSDADFIDKPVAVLINGSSASASEALAGALRDMGGAVLVGTKSFGKGIMQTNYPLDNGGMFKLTTAKYYLPGGECIHGIGLTPDYEVELSDELTQKYWLRTENNDLQLQKAIDLLTN